MSAFLMGLVFGVGGSLAASKVSGPTGYLLGLLAASAVWIITTRLPLPW